jgi:mono/diheme cytochrome c family protein
MQAHRRGQGARFRVALVLVIVCASGFACGGEEEGGPPSASADLGRGKEAYVANCAACHGKDLKGTKSGPPFLDAIYAPDHHSDEAFFSAVENGVRPHHWEFGPMPPQPAVSQEDVEAIVTYVRAQQVEAGIIEGPAE